jgi:hypothetical protein
VRVNDWLIILAHLVIGRMYDITCRRHLTTDPACREHVAPKAGSRLDRESRGVECDVCMVRRAFGLQQ